MKNYHGIPILHALSKPCPVKGRGLNQGNIVVECGPKKSER